jgi:glycosyltransferase involved in cell wall biosynthesis
VKVKIVIDARELRTSTGRYIERLLHYLQLIDSNNDYTVLLKPADIAGWAPTNPRFNALPCPFKEFTFSEQYDLNRQIKSLKPDLVHFAMTQQPALYAGIKVTTVHDLTTTRFRNPSKNALVFTFKQWVYIWLTKRVARTSAAIITPSQYVKNDLLDFSGIDPNKVTVTPEAADVFEASSEPISALQDKQFIMFVGRPLPHKNLRRLIAAFAQLHGKRKDLYLMIGGKIDASHADYVRYVQSLHIAEFVVFTDWISDGQLKWSMEHTQAYVWPSLSEGFGLPPLEAMLYGAPVVSSNATCMPEVLGNAAHYFDPHDVTAMADAIDEVLSNDNLRNQLITAGKSQAASYSWQRMAQQTLEIYYKIMGH